MTFRNKKHAERFYEALVDCCISVEDKEVMAAVYLLTCHKKIWNKFKDHVDGEDGICPLVFDKFEARNQTENALVTAAYDILFCTDCINLTDLTDRDSIPDEAFLTICHAIGYLRFGFEEGPIEPHIVEYA